jgi:hypothetical protein
MRSGTGVPDTSGGSYGEHMSATDTSRCSKDLYFFADIHCPLHDPLHLFKLRAHALTCTSKCDRVLQLPANVRVIHESLFYCLPALRYSAYLKLWHDIHVTIHFLVNSYREEHVPVDIRPLVFLGRLATPVVRLHLRFQMSCWISSISCHSGHWFSIRRDSPNLSLLLRFLCLGRFL